MAAKKINKSAFVRGLSASMPAPEVVKAAAAKGIKLSVKFVHTIRYNAKVSAKKKSGGAAPSAVAVVKRGPGRPPKSASAPTSHASSGSHGGLIGEIERIVERKVSAMLKERLGALFA
jgi:hypothetical protein